MTVVREVSDLLKIAADGVENIRSIHKAAKDGYAYLNRYHEDARADLAGLLDELVKLTQVTAEASAIVTRFDFTVAGTDVGREPARFNKYLVQHKTVQRKLAAQLDETRTHCSQVGYHYAGLKAKAENGDNPFAVLFKARRTRAEQLAHLVGDIYSDDSRVLEQFTSIANAIDLALEDVRSVLAPDGEARPEHVPRAARVLAQHAKLFRPIESEANFAAGELRSLIIDLRKPPRRR
jgi:hypothetical protein